MAPDPSEEPENLDTPPAFFPAHEFAEGIRASQFGEPIEVNVEGVFIAQNGGDVQRFVLLTDGVRKLPISIGEPEATAITLPLEDKKPGRPLTHDLLVTILGRVGATLEKVVIDDLWQSTYYAKLFFNIDGNMLEIDSRPSDAIAIAVRMDAPIFVSDAILDQLAT